jgi:hypothetical protein
MFIQISMNFGTLYEFLELIKQKMEIGKMIYRPPGQIRPMSVAHRMRWPEESSRPQGHGGPPWLAQPSAATG